jgi:hypothetical protein
MPKTKMPTSRRIDAAADELREAAHTLEKAQARFARALDAQRECADARLAAEHRFKGALAAYRATIDATAPQDATQPTRGNHHAQATDAPSREGTGIRRRHGIPAARQGLPG